MAQATDFMKSFCLIVCWLLFFQGNNGPESLEDFKRQFATGYAGLPIPEMQYDYHDYFASIPSISSVRTQKDFFLEQNKRLQSIAKKHLSFAERLDYFHIKFEIDFNLNRLNLEEAWIGKGRKIPENGLSSLPDAGAWYAYFVKKFTSTDISPVEVFEMGEKSLEHVKGEISRIRTCLGFTDSASFYVHLKDDGFFIKDKRALLDSFFQIDATVRNRLSHFVTSGHLPPICPIEWPNPGPATPPGMYLNHRFTAYGQDVFQFNFFGGRFNRRALEWLYMHEAIPGHHLQATTREAEPTDILQEMFLYPGNFEGWACYIEDFGKDLGLYQNLYSELGKWEWDLVRSARLVLDVGIHYYGWSQDQALEYWKKVVPGQDDIAEREVLRVTNWCAQTLSYKVGSTMISQMKGKWLKKNAGKIPKDFHDMYLRFGMRPLSVIQQMMML